MRNLIISELEKTNILKKYGVLNEQSTPVQNNQITQPQQENGKTVMTVDKYVVFPAGYYNQSYLEQSDIAKEVQNIIKFLDEVKNSQTTKRYIVSLNIESGESRIPNTDKEKGNVRVDSGILATNRSNTIVTYVNTLLGPYVGNVLAKKIEPNINPPKIGDTKWIGQPFCPQQKLLADDKQGYACTGSNFKPGPNIQNWYNGKNKQYKSIFDQYKREQYIRVTITVNESTIQSTPTPTPTPTGSTVQIECLNNMVIELNYTDKSKNHECNNAVYRVYIKGDKTPGNGVLLLRDDGKDYASLNNDTKTLKDLMTLNPLEFIKRAFKSEAQRKRQDTKKEKLRAVLQYDNNPQDNGGARYNKFIVNPDIAKQITDDGSTKFYVLAQCYNPLVYSSGNWGKNCHSSVGEINVTNGKGERFEYQSKTPNKMDEIVTLLPINACGQKIPS